MGVVYFSHSYRPEDANLNNYFTKLIKKKNLIPSLDPPSKTKKFSAAKMLGHLSHCDGMIAILNDREQGPSPYILFEIYECIKAKKPLLVFIENTISDDLIPQRILQKRFSRRSYYRQAKEHQQALEIFKSYLCKNLTPKYQSFNNKKRCIAAGFSFLPDQVRQQIVAAIELHGYSVIHKDNFISQTTNKASFFDLIVSTDLVVIYLAGQNSDLQGILGSVEWASLPYIAFTDKPELTYPVQVPEDLQSIVCDFSDVEILKQQFEEQIELFEEDYLDLTDEKMIEDYIDDIIKYNDSLKQSTDNLRQIIINSPGEGVINIADTIGATNRDIFANEVKFQSIWNEIQNKVNLEELLDELKKMESELSKPQYENKTKIKDQLHGIRKALEKGDGPHALNLIAKLKDHKSFIEDLCSKIVSTSAASSFVFILSHLFHF